MDSIKVKNFIIIVLVLVNAVLLSVFVSDAVRERALAGSAVDGAVELLAENGITVDAGADLSERRIETLSVLRDTAAEREAAASLLGSAEPSDQGGNILLYFGMRGEASFRGTGRMEINLRAGEYASDDPLSTARSFARELGLETMREPLGSSIDESTGEGTLVLGCAHDGVRVVNCTLSFTFAGGSLIGVYGTRVLDTVEQGRQQAVIDVPTVLMRFLSLVLEGGHVCSSLNELELCYHMTATAAGEGELIPVWRIETDAGDFYINAVTGVEEHIA